MFWTGGFDRNSLRVVGFTNLLRVLNVYYRETRGTLNAALTACGLQKGRKPACRNASVP